MGIITLSQAVERFAAVTQAADGADLARPWAWGDYDSEGVRFAFFRTYEELCELAVKIGVERARLGQGATSAQRILAYYHAAVRELQAALLELSPEDLDRAPASGEWPVHQVLAHIIGADVGFYVAIRFALDRRRSGESKPTKIPAEAWDELIGLDEQAFNAIMAGPLSDLISYWRLFHERILGDFADTSEQELETQSMYWENQPLSVRFRLGRFDSHLRQHAVQIDKALIGIGQPPTEAKRLLRLVFSALGEVEGAGISAPEVGARWRHDAAQAIWARAEEMGGILTQS